MLVTILYARKVMHTLSIQHILLSRTKYVLISKMYHYDASIIGLSEDFIFKLSL